MDLGEFFDWKNANAVSFTKREDGVFWVTQAFVPLLTPEIEATITGNQPIVSTFVVAPKLETQRGLYADPIPTAEVLSDEEFCREIAEM